jgi:hypothetical protein
MPPPQEFERSTFWNSSNYGVKTKGVEVTLNGITEFHKIYQLVKKFLVGDIQMDIWTERLNGDFTSLTLFLRNAD